MKDELLQIANTLLGLLDRDFFRTSDYYCHMSIEDLALCTVLGNYVHCARSTYNFNSRKHRVTIVCQHTPLSDLFDGVVSVHVHRKYRFWYAHWVCARSLGTEYTERHGTELIDEMQKLAIMWKMKYC